MWVVPQVFMFTDSLSHGEDSVGQAFLFLKGVNSMKDIPYKIYLTEEEMPRY